MTRGQRLGAAVLAGVAILAGLALWLLGGSDAPADDGTRTIATATAPPSAELPLVSPLTEAVPDAASALVEPVTAAAPVATFTGELELSFTGRVVDRSGRGILGARVELLPAPSNLNLSGVPIGATPPALASATSDSDGAYRLPLAEGEVSGAASSTYLRAVAAGFAPAVRLVHPSRAGETTLGTVVLMPGGVVRGRIVDTEGRPVADVVLAEAPPTATLTGGPQRVLFDAAPALTGSDGRFELEHVNAGIVALLVLAPGHPAWRSSTIASLPAGGHVDVGTLMLPAGESFSGRLLDSNGPVAGGTITLLGLPGSTSIATRSDVDGRFAFGGLPRRSLRLKAEAPGHVMTQLGVELPVAAPVEVSLPLPHKFLVRALDADGRPVRQGRVSLRSGRVEVCGADFREGVAEIELLADGLMLITADGCAPTVIDGPEDLKQGDGTVQLEREAVIRGRAHLFEPDTALAGLRVRTSNAPAELSKAGYRASAITDAEGRFELRGLAAGEWPISADRAGLRPGRFGTTLAAGETKELDLAFVAGGRIEGFVKTSVGAPRAGVEVNVKPQKPVGMTDDTGHFVIEGLTPGDLSVKVSNTPIVESVLVEEGQTATVTLIVPATGVITGRVHSRSRDIVDARVVLRSTGSREVKLAVDTRGEFRAEELLPGTWTVEARLADGLRRATVPVELLEGAEQRVDIDVAAGSLRVLVKRAEDGEPLSGAIVRVESGASNASGELVTGADGAVVLADLPPGEVRLLVRAEKRVEVEHKAELKAGVAETLVEVALDGAARIEGRVSASDGGDLRVLVMLQRADGNTQGPVAEGWNFLAFMRPVAAAGDRSATVKDGKFSFDHVPPGSVRLVVRQIGAPTAAAGLGTLSLDVKGCGIAQHKPEVGDLATLPLELRAGDVARPEITVQPSREK